MLLQSVEAVCRGIVEQAAAAAEVAQKDCAAWKAKYEAALDRCNQQEFKVSMTISHVCMYLPQEGEHCSVPVHILATGRMPLYCLHCAHAMWLAAVHHLDGLVMQ